VDHVLAGRADDALGRLAVDVVADARGVDADALARDVDRLFALCPGLGERVARGEVKRALAAELAVTLKATMEAMLAIKMSFVSADVDAASVCAREPRLLRLRGEALEGVRGRLESTRARFGDARDADGFLATIPSCLVAPEEEFEAVVERVVGLRALMPEADVVKLLRGRPGLCLDERAYSRAAIAVAALRKAMPKDCRIDLMLSDFPSLLFMDIDMLLDDLRQTFGGDPCWTLRRNPGIATQVRLIRRAHVVVRSRTWHDTTDTAIAHSSRRTTALSIRSDDAPRLTETRVPVRKEYEFLRPTRPSRQRSASR